MTASDDYCELCDLPKSQCIHGLPPPPDPVKPASRPATTSTPRPRTATRSKAAPPAARQVSRRWTPPDAFKPLIIAVLQDAGGAMQAEELFLELETRADNRMLAGDREATPEGELRWQYAARRARQALIKDGLMVSGRPGVWELSPAGRRTTG